MSPLSNFVQIAGEEAWRRQSQIKMQDHVWRSLFLNTFDDPQKNNESHSLETPVQVVYQAAHVLRLVGERYDAMGELWDNIAKETWDMGLIKAFKACATTLRSSIDPNRQRPGAPRIFRFSESLMAKPECPFTHKIFLALAAPIKVKCGPQTGTHSRHVLDRFRLRSTNPRSMVQPWEPHVHANAPVLPAEWAKLEISRVVDDSGQGIIHSCSGPIWEGVRERQFPILVNTRGNSNHTNIGII
ncbi:hypothetical protein BS47DRAFT_1383281 [Hydnum rufescens UP504]|uniref:Uncharacterized protein n=1 Tax=Hydnum rufescens UP504 TaxID=1448309 RepID=A0A9P6ATM1_9AGAM|nr:hypothetical protein BS47DRAFT_1383281 [Hydnum rufescens UP504]